MSKAFKYLIPLIVGLTIYFIPSPQNLDFKGWHLFAIFVATIVALITKPLAMGGVALISLTSVILTGTIETDKVVLSGFSSSISWLIVFVFFIARAFIKVRLGTRIAYLFTLMFGRSSLGLGYSLIITDLIIAPFMPSSAARSGGIIYPIFRALAESVGSSPEEKTERRLGAFLSQICFHSNYITNTLFLTAMAANPMIQAFASSQNINITWGNWALAASVPGIISLIIIPLFIYFAYPPELKFLPNTTQLARQKLSEMGPVSRQEWTMLGVFALMLILWIIGENYGISTTTTALLGICLLLFTNIIKVEDLLNENEAWHTLIWFSILIMLSQNLQTLGVVDWFSKVLSGYITNFHWQQGFILIALIYFYIHYLFASITSHISTLYAAFLSLAIGIGTPPLLAALLLGFVSNFSACLTHYGSTGAVVFASANFVPIRTWWALGFATSLINIIIWGSIGPIWWKFINIY